MDENDRIQRLTEAMFVEYLKEVRHKWGKVLVIVYCRS